MYAPRSSHLPTALLTGELILSAEQRSTMYKVATALNHKDERWRLGYTGKDQFLTNVDGDLKMMPDSSSPGQKWLLTGEGCLKNGTGLYLTACPDKSLKFLPRSAA